MSFDKKLFDSNLKGISLTPVTDEEINKFLFALSEAEEFGLAALVAFSFSLRSQLIDMKDKYNISVEENKSN